MGTKILLSGIYTKQLLDTIIKCKCRFVRLSFSLFRKSWKKDILALQKILSSFEYVMFDFGIEKVFGKGNKSAEVKKYRKEYIEFLNENGKYINVILDDTGILGSIPVIPNKESWDLFCGKFSYLAVDSNFMSLGVSKISGLINRASNSGIKIHGIGITGQEYLNKARFFSVDSTTWTTGPRFGNTYIFENHKLKTYNQTQKNKVRKQYAAKWRREGLFDVDAMLKDSSKAVNEMNCIEWVKFQNYIYSQSNKDYWEENKKETPIKNEIVQVENKEVAIINKENLMSAAIEQILPCDSCYLRGRCQFYKKGNSCKYNLPIEIRSSEELVNQLTRLIGIQFERVYKGALVEKLDGGILDKGVSDELQKTFDMALQLRDLISPQDEVVLRAKGKKGLNVFSEIFGDMVKKVGQEKD